MNTNSEDYELYFQQAADCLVCPGVLALDAANSCEVPPRWYIDPGAGSDGGGESWDDPFNSLSSALTASDSDNRPIWIKEGTFTAVSESAVFAIESNNRAIYGGFSAALTGTDGDVDARDLLDWTVLNGDELSIHVVEVSGQNVILNGFVIQNGDADGGEPAGVGGGLFVEDTSNISLANLLIQGNTSASSDNPAEGGGLYAWNVAGLSLDSVFFANNEALGSTGFAAEGGGAFFHGCTGSLTDVWFTENTAWGGPGAPGGAGRDGRGGGALLEDCAFEVLRLVSLDNVARGGDGGIGITANGGNGGDANGAGIWLIGAGTAFLADATVSDNVATAGSGGMGGMMTCPGGELGDMMGMPGGAAGSARGGGIWATDAGLFTLSASTVTGNAANSGTPGTGGAGSGGPCGNGSTGSPGVAEGGGVYSSSSVVEADGTTVSDNTPDDVFED